MQMLARIKRKRVHLQAERHPLLAAVFLRREFRADAMHFDIHATVDLRTPDEFSRIQWMSIDLHFP